MPFPRESLHGRDISDGSHPETLKQARVTINPNDGQGSRGCVESRW
jgi:hypothetical protein